LLDTPGNQPRDEYVWVNVNANVKSQPMTGSRIVAILMMVGGAAGVVSSLRFAAYNAIQDQPSTLVVRLCAILLFGWTVWVGLGLWRGKAHSIWWAKVLFGMQVLFFNVGGFAYEFWNGLTARITVAGWLEPTPPPAHSVSIGGDFGAWFNLNLTEQGSRWMVGVNLVALIVLVYLLRHSRIYQTDTASAAEQEEAASG
jgi:hypothetical protein